MQEEKGTMLRDPDRLYRRTMLRLGAALLVFLVLFRVMGPFLRGVCWLLGYRAEKVSETISVTVSELQDGMAYLLSFMLPVLVWRWMTPRTERQPMPFAPTVPRTVPLIIPAAVAIVLTTAVVNSRIMAMWGLSFPSASLPGEPAPYEAYRIVLMYLSTALIPAFCEEFLFRGLILRQLLPFGRTVAVVVSALTFGLMHQNAAQMFYATVAGLVLGFLCAETGSLFSGILVHLFNNLISVTEDVLTARFPGSAGNRLNALLEMTVIAVGLLCLAVFLLRHDRAVCAAGENPWQTGQKMTRGDAALWRPEHPIRGFLCPTMAVFVAVCVFEMGYYFYILARYLW